MAIAVVVLLATEYSSCSQTDKMFSKLFSLEPVFKVCGFRPSGHPFPVNQRSKCKKPLSFYEFAFSPSVFSHLGLNGPIFIKANVLNEQCTSAPFKELKLACFSECKPLVNTTTKSLTMQIKKQIYLNNVHCNMMNDRLA